MIEKPEVSIRRSPGKISEIIPHASLEEFLFKCLGESKEKSLYFFQGNPQGF